MNPDRSSRFAYQWKVLPFLVAMLAIVGSAEARSEAPPPCFSAAKAWAASCASSQGIDVSPIHCSSQLASFRLGHEGAALDVEIRSDGANAFRQVGSYGLSPIGEFPDWSSAPLPIREAFDKLTTCVEAGMGGEGLLHVLPGRARNDAGSRGLGAASSPLPEPGDRGLVANRLTKNLEAVASFLPRHLFGALVATLFVAIALLRRARPSRGIATSAALLALGIGTWTFRRFFIPSAFFHQNGHGSMWVDCALGGHCSYGPGFRDAFGFAARIHLPTAEQGIFLANSLLAATGPISAWLIARAAGAPRIVAWAIALVLAMDPGLGRLAGSESYYGTVTWLFLWASALLATGARLGGPRSASFLVAAGGAGFLIGQAVAIHPIAWIPSALVPLSVFVGPGALRRRMGFLLVGTFGSGLVAFASAGRLVIEVYRSNQQWATSLGGGFVERLLSLNAILVGIIALMGGGIALYRLRRRHRPIGPALRWGLRAAVLVLVVMIGELLNPVHHLPPWIQHAWWGAYLPSIIAAVAALVAIRRRHPLSARLAGASILAVGIVFSATRWDRLLALPTDALEARFAMTWRELLPQGARILHLQRVGDRITTLPIFSTPMHDVRLVTFDAGSIDRAMSIATLPGAYYHRSSLCSTDEGRALCETIERELKLEPVSVATLPALPSMPHMMYDADNVRVGLYRIANNAQPKL